MTLKTPLSVAEVRFEQGAREDISAASIALDLMDTRITKRHPEIGRPKSASQVICPFLGICIRNGMLSMVVHPEYTGESHEAIRRQIEEYYEQFKAQKDPDPAREQLRALVIIFPNLLKIHERILTLVQRQLKDMFVPQGYMIGEFFESCEVGATYNPAFPVMWSPIPFVAIRNMLPHDVQFLRHDRRMFTLWNERFGSHFAPGAKIHHSEEHLVLQYHAALAMYNQNPALT